MNKRIISFLICVTLLVTFAGCSQNKLTETNPTENTAIETVPTESIEETKPNIELGPAVFDEGCNWYRGKTDRTAIVTINFVEEYVPTGTEIESWAADKKWSGSIMCYVMGDTLIVAGKNMKTNENANGMFAVDHWKTPAFTNLKTITGLDALDTSETTSMNGMFSGCTSLESLDISNFNMTNVIDTEYMFRNCESLKDLKFEGVDTSNVVNMKSMFEACKSLESLTITFNTSSVTDMSYMFGGCSELTVLDVSKMDTSNVINMRGMFGCPKLTKLDVSNFNTSNVENMSFMFSYHPLLTELDLSSFDTSKVTTMGNMFSECKGLTTLDLSNFDFTNVTDMGSMFWHCELLEMDYSNWNVPNVENHFLFSDGCKNVIEPNWKK